MGIVHLMSPTTLMEASNGVLINGLNNTSNSNGRKKREIIGKDRDCQIICKQITPLKSVDNSNKFYLKGIYDKCLNDCIS